MQFLQLYGKEIVALFVPFFTWFLNVGLKGRAKLIWVTRHSFSLLVQEPLRNDKGEIVKNTQMVRTASLRVLNEGRLGATKIELVFNWTPQYMNLWPVRSYDQKTDGDRRHILIFDNLSPKEEIGIEIMAINNELPQLIQVRCAECMGEQVEMMWIRQVQKWKINLARMLIFFGGAAFVYMLIVLLQFLVLKTPDTTEIPVKTGSLIENKK